MSSNNRNRRWTNGVGTVGVAFAALIVLAPAARADTEPDPFEDLLGTRQRFEVLARGSSVR
jgi:hypothetical protein